MRNKLALPLMLVAAVVLFTIAVLPMTASAILRDDGQSDSTADQTETRTLQGTKRQRLTDDKLRRCQQRNQRIQGIMQRGTKQAENHAERFTAIYERVKTFYERKGKTIATYDDLVAAVETAKTKAETGITALSGLDDFSCDSDDPKGNAEAYKEALRAVREDLKAYRTTIKDLIVGVRSAQSAGEGE